MGKIQLKRDRLNFDELEAMMEVVKKEEQKSYIGGGDGSESNPYTWNEYRDLAQSNLWYGGYVDGVYYGSEPGSDVGSYNYTDGNAGTHVVIITNRIQYFATSTISSYTMNVCSCSGILFSHTGFFLEPVSNPALATTSGSNTAISTGSYSVFWNGPSSRYQLNDVPGRSGIQIHVGNDYNDTSGCFCVGSNWSNNGTVSGSTTATAEFYRILDTYGYGGITIIVQ